MTKKLYSKDVNGRRMEYRSSGREPWVYAAETPQDLLGVHADLIASSLLPEEDLQYLLYSPIWAGDWAPFGITAQTASHALGVTDKRFLLSRDLHRDNVAPEVFSFPFEHVLWVEYGNAILLGWFSLYCARKDGPERVSILFKSTGEKYFTAVLRCYRQTLPRRNSISKRQKSTTWEDFWNRVSEVELSGISPLLLEKETLRGFFRAEMKWRYRRKLLRRQPVCERPENLLLWTSSGVFHVIREPDIRPEIHSFGFTVRSIPWDAIRLAEVITEETLQLTLGSNKADLRLDVPFEKEYRDQAELLVRLIERKSSP